MSLSAEGVRRRDHLVFEFAANTLETPLIITMGGGYPHTGADWSPILDAHANVYMQAYNFLATKLGAGATKNY